jgi:hypothetical protein
MKEPNGTSGGGADDSDSSSDFVTESQLSHILGLHELELKNLAYDTLDANQKINLLTIRTLGIVYGLVAVVYLLATIFTAKVTLAKASASLESLLVVFVAFYGLVMLLSEAAQKTISSAPPSTEDIEPAPNEE